MIRITGALSVRSSHGWSVSCVVPVPVLCWPTRPDWGRCWARPVQGVEGSIRSGDPILLRELTFGRASGWCGLGGAEGETRYPSLHSYPAEYEPDGMNTRYRQDKR
jgi:hypothetical protein